MQTTLEKDRLFNEESLERPSLSGQVREDVSAACGLIPPLWTLRDYVAVNPFLGFADQPISQAARTIKEGLSADVLPTLDHYRKSWANDDFDEDDLATTVASRGGDVSRLRALLEGGAPVESELRHSRSFLTFAERCDIVNSTDWHSQVLRSQARWCAVYVSPSSLDWDPAASGTEDLYNSWRSSACVDRTLEIMGLLGWRERMRQLPADAEAAIADGLRRLGVPQQSQRDYFYRLLGGLYGWASYFRQQVWTDSDSLGQMLPLLAMRISGDVAVCELAGSERVTSLFNDGVLGMTGEQVDEGVLLTLQNARENAYARSVIGRLHAPEVDVTNIHEVNRPAVEAVFCIDVRSEVLRRHFEAVSPDIKTRGFAGFFGVTVGVEGEADQPISARCPVLLNPSFTIQRQPSTTFWKSLTRVLQRMQSAPAAAFSLVELLGLGYASKLAADATTGRALNTDHEAVAEITRDDTHSDVGLSLADQVELAVGILKNTQMGGNTARLILLCGHGSRTANNPHATGLDCGACGGHGGALNARIAAAVLNNPLVRAELASRSLFVSSDTHFLPGLHNTTDDEVALLDLLAVPDSHRDDVASLRRSLAVASAATRSERATRLGMANDIGRTDVPNIGKIFSRRSRDPSQVRPEWGLARNAAFIAARRSRTRGLNLDGRTFLHDYDSVKDEDSSVLTLILSAPMVVASWINLQYFASTVDNKVLGSGDKTLHNRVGSVGVVEGNGGDLRTGLAYQSVFNADGTMYHEPLRLAVMVEASCEKITGVLQNRPDVSRLVENEWVKLYAISPTTPGDTHEYVPSCGWSKMVR